MSFLCTIIEFIQNLCLEEAEFSITFKDIDEINRENMATDNQLEELDREYGRLQIELCNLETIAAKYQGIDSENITKTSKKIYEGSMEMFYLINKIDNTKILQCHHMEWEAKLRGEWQLIQERFVETLKRHDQMEQRNIVKKYNQTEMVLRNVTEVVKNQHETMANSYQQSKEVLNKTIKRRNEIILNIIKGSKATYNLKQKMLTLKKYEFDLNGLREEKINLSNQLEKTQHKVFKPIITLNNTKTLLNSTQNLKSFNFIMPKFPSFTEVLNSFKEKETKITVIGDNKNVFLKSILHSSNDSSLKANQSILTKQTKHVRFKAQLEEYQTKETESETHSDLSQNPNLEVTEENVKENNIENIFKHNNLQRENAKVDISAPITTGYNIAREQQDTTNSTDYDSNIIKENEMVKSIQSKSPIEILECVTFKTPQPIQTNINVTNKENILQISATSTAKQFCSTNSIPSVDESGKLNKSFYEEFINLSSSEEVSPSNKRRAVLKDFESYLNESREFLFTSKESVKNKSNEAELLFPQNKANDEKNSDTEQDFLDFGNERGFTFDSDDMTENCNAADMDFM